MARKIKKIGGQEQEGGANWLTTFNDLMTLLMVFFVLIFTMSSLDLDKSKGFQDSLQSALGVLLEGDKVGVAVVDTTRDFDMETVYSDDEFYGGADAAESMPTSEENHAERILRELSAEAGVQTAADSKFIKIRLENNILFLSGSAALQPAGFPVLQKIAEAVTALPNPVRVEGHTDDRPIHSEKYPSNWELSIARAVNVVRFLAEKANVAPRRLSAAGYGDSFPLVPNDTSEHRNQNRRVEILLIKNEDPME